MSSSICSSFSAPLSSSRALQRTVLSSPSSHSHYHLNFHFRTQKALRVSTHPPPPLSLKVLCTREFRAPAVTKNSWEKSILNSEIPVLVEFYASWCGPCRMVHRVIDEISRDYAGRLKFFVLNTDNDLQVAEDYEIKAVPVVVLFKNGEKRESVVGTMPKEFYVAAIERVLKS